MDNGESSYRRFLAGDNEGLREIVCSYRAGLMLYLNSYVQNIHTAEELTEDTFFELLKKRPSFTGQSSFKTWLYAIGRNLTAKYLRKNARFSVVPLESQEHLSDEESIEENYFKSEQKRMVHQALRRLKSEYRQVLFLTYFEGFTNAESAAIMKKTEKQIRDLLYHARKALKSELERRGFQYEDE